MIREFKARLFADALNLPLREIDTGDLLWVERIDAHFASSGTLPPDGDPDEYAAAFEAAYPSEADRRTYIDGKVAGARPSYGHRVLAALVASGQADCMFTTNFDPLVETAVAVARDLTPTSSGGALTVASIDSAERATRCVAESDWPLLVKLHGDFKESRLKNTTAELQDQDESLRRPGSEQELSVPEPTIGDERLSFAVTSALLLLGAHATRAGAGGTLDLIATIHSNHPTTVGHTRHLGFVDQLGDRTLSRFERGVHSLALEDLDRPGPGLISASYWVASDLIATFGFPESPQLAATGHILLPYVSQGTRASVKTWAERHHIQVIENLG